MTYDERLNECLAAIKNGDQTKYHDLQNLTYGPLINVAKSYLFNKSDAEDVMSELYLRIYKYAEHYDTSMDAYTYLWQIVKNKAYDYNKQHLKNKTVNIDDVVIQDKTDQIEQSITKTDIAAALKRVGHTNALIVIWTYRDRLTQEVIGKRLGISKPAVCQRLSRTKAELAKYLKKY